MMQEPACTSREIAMAKLKIKCSWGVAVVGLVLPTVASGIKTWSRPVECIFAAMICAYYFWCLFWIIEGSLGPFFQRHAKILIPALAINLPAMGCMGCLVLVILFPIGIIAAFIIAVVVSFILMATALVCIFWGCFGGGIYYFRKCRRIARSTPCADVVAEAQIVPPVWYAHINGEQIGPSLSTEIRDEIKRRGAEATALVARAGDDGWIPFADSPIFK